MNVWTGAAIGLAAAFLPAGIGVLRGTMISRIAAVQLLSVFTTLALLAIPLAMHRPDLFDAAVASAIVSVAGTILFTFITLRWMR